MISTQIIKTLKKKFLLFFFLSFPLSICADDGGSCGTNVDYSYNSTTHTLTIYGEGPMMDSDNQQTFPWNPYRSDIKYLIIESGVTSISNYAFSNINGLTSINIPNSVTTIGEYAFYGCEGMSSLTIPNSVTAIGRGTFSHCSSLTSITIPNSVTTIERGMFSYCSSLTSITIPNGATTIGVCAFWNCTSLTSITIPNSVMTIERSAFDSCSSLTSITIPNSVTSIGDRAFGDCSGLISVTIGTNVTSIGDSSFKGCSGLTSITIPNSVTSIEVEAFSGCTGLTSIVSEIKNPFYIGSIVSNDIFMTATLIVPAGTLSSYQETARWNRFQNIVEAEPKDADFMVNGVNYVIASENEHTVMVNNGNYGHVLDVPATITYGNNTWNVIGLTDGALDDNGNLAAIIWNPSIAFNARVSNPNLLLYVKDKAYKSSDIKNVVVNGVAESIELTDAANDNDFYCPRTFTAKKISYTHDYKMETGIGESKGWETIVLPFDVQKYTHTTIGGIEPFTTWNTSSNTKPFWLFELTASGYKDVAGIKANTPYIISMPNNKQYEQQYQIPGIVTFSASNVEVQKTDDLKPVSYQGRTFVPNYTNKASDNILALNVNSYYVTNSSTEIDGGKFIRGLRAVHPFEAYMTTTDGTRSIDVFDGMITAIKGVGMVKEGESDLKVYDTKGVLLKTSTSMDDVRKGLKAGVYIVNGKKVIIK